MTKGVHLPRKSLICPTCEKEFSCVGSDRDRRYCSINCWPKAKPPKTVKCIFCGTTKTQTTHKSEQLYCSASCARRHYNEQRKERNRVNGFWANYREAKTRLLEERAACQSCGWDKFPEVLELHHVDRNRRNNHISNLKLICPNCHTVEHFMEGTGQFQNNIGRR